MDNPDDRERMTERIASALPYLRRHARALTGQQGTGDALAAEALERLVRDSDLLADGPNVALGLFAGFHRNWEAAGRPFLSDAEGLEARAQDHMRRLPDRARAALLLYSVEGFTTAEIGRILDIGQPEAQMLVDEARQEMAQSIAGRVLIIEDEAIIAFDLREIVAGMGHSIVGMARTHAEAVGIGRERPPQLILADVKLADDSSGIAAVDDLMELAGETPVIYITAYPERLLTGLRAEPAFVIAKPYHEDQIRSAVSQAMFFAPDLPD